MKKAAILVQSKDGARTVENLRALGLLHVEHQNAPCGEDVSCVEDDLALVEAALGILSQEEISPRRLQEDEQDLSDWKFTAKHVIDLHNRLSQLREYAFTLHNKIIQWQAWGDFDPQAITALKEKGIDIRLYQIPVKQLRRLPAQLIVKKIFLAGGMANCLVLSRQKVDLPFREITLPKSGLVAMQARLSENKHKMESIKDEICKDRCYRQSFLRIRRSLEEELEFQKALSGMGKAQGLMYLTGFIPDDAIRPLQQAAKSQSWGIIVKDPSEEDRVPTLIRNPRWISIISPVFRFLEVIPGYKELDISPWFLIFFSIFFGMLVGDIGIGLIFLALTGFAQRKWGKQLPDNSVFVLLYISSFAAVIWGLLCGTFFGQEWLPQSVKPLLPALRDDKNIQAICFFIGALHLSIAHSWRAIIKMPSFSALAEFGWILILWGGFFLARMLILGDNLPEFAKWFFITGAALVIFFTRPSRNLIKGIGAGLGNLLLNVVNSFTDVVSYVRLFAVGLATVAVADAFNRMAMEIGCNNVIQAILAALVLVLGHTLNVLLAPMSVLVHGIRLNVLEFCNHADVKWSGFAYNPLRRKSVEDK